MFCAASIVVLFVAAVPPALKRRQSRLHQLLVWLIDIKMCFLSASDARTATECASHDRGPSHIVYAVHVQMECLRCMSTARSHIQTGVFFGAWQAMATALQTIGKFVVKKKVGEQEQIFGR